MRNKITIVRYKIVQSLWAAAGTIALLLGILGIFLPLLPTTPFILLASICCAKSSERLFDVLVIRRPWGKYLTEKIKRKGLSAHEIIASLLFLWVTILLFLVWIDRNGLRFLLLLIAVATSHHLYRS